jgi:hypothetical protein
MRTVPVVVALVAGLTACSGMESGSGSVGGGASLQSQISPACMGLDQVACTANTACFWQMNSMGCGTDMMMSCGMDQCVDAATGNLPPPMACRCGDGSGMEPLACVRDGSMMIDCRPMPPACGPLPIAPTVEQTASFCACLMGASGTPCHAAADVKSMCDCD